MGFFTREKKDGRRTFGYGVYLMAGIASFAGVAFLRHHMLSGAPPARVRRPAASNVMPITEPASMVAPVAVKAASALGDEAKSYRLATPSDAAKPAANPPAVGEHETFATIDQALQAAEKADRDDHQAPEDERRLPGAAEARTVYAPLPPAFAEETVRGAVGTASEAILRGVQLLGYRDSEAEPPAQAIGTGTKGSPAASEFSVPRGTLVRAFLLTTVDTGNPSAVLQFGTARALVFNHTYQLPFGTRFLGKMSGQPTRDRVTLSADTILYPDGLELPVTATAVEADEAGSNIRPGIEAYYFPPPQWAQISPYVADFITGYMGLLQSRAEQPLTASLGGLSLQTTNSTDPRPPLYQASAQAIQAFTQARLKDIEQRYATYYLIPAGTACWLQLDRDLDLSRAHAARRVAAPEGGAKLQ